MSASSIAMPWASAADRSRSATIESPPMAKNESSGRTPVVPRTSSKSPHMRRSAGLAGTRHPQWTPAGQFAAVGAGRRLIVDLAVVVERESRRPRPRTRAPCSRAGWRAGARTRRRREDPVADHVGDDPGAGGRLRRGAADQLAGVGEPGHRRGPLRHHVRRWRLVHDHRGLPHPGHAGERGLDLAQLDAEAADLDLVVAAAVVDVLAGRRCGPRGRRTGSPRTPPTVDEPLGGQVGPVQVADRHAGSGDHDLAGLPVRHRVQLARRRARSPDRTVARRSGCPCGRGRRARTRRYEACTVVSVMPYMLTRRGAVSPYLATQRRRSAKPQRLAAEDHVPQRQPVGVPGVLGDQLGERGRCLVEDRDALVPQQARGTRPGRSRRPGGTTTTQPP